MIAMIPMIAMIAMIAMPSHRTGARVLLALVLLVVSPGLSPQAQAPAADGDPVLARAFEVRYRALADAAEVVDAVLSPDGEITLRSRLKTLVVQDRRSVLDRVAALLENYDVPPRNAEITISLVMGTDVNKDRPQSVGASGLSEEVRGVLESLRDFTRWVDYEPLGSRSVIGTEGEQVVVNLSRDYRVVFVVESVLEKQGKVHFERFALQQLRVEEGGEESFEDIVAARMVLRAGRVNLVGAAKDPNSKNALFLAVQANPQGDSR